MRGLTLLTGEDRLLLRSIQDSQFFQAMEPTEHALGEIDQLIVRKKSAGHVRCKWLEVKKNIFLRQTTMCWPFEAAFPKLSSVYYL
jgi:hypothetical protein